MRSFAPFFYLGLVFSLRIPLLANRRTVRQNTWYVLQNIKEIIHFEPDYECLHVL